MFKNVIRLFGKFLFWYIVTKAIFYNDMKHSNNSSLMKYNFFIQH